MNIEEYIDSNYNGKRTWFVDEVELPEHRLRILRVMDLKKYLHRQHKILEKPDASWKGQSYKTKKQVLQTLKGILRFHTSYSVGNQVNLRGSDNMVKVFNKVYREGNYHNVDYKAVDNVIKFGDSYEYVYVDKVNGKNVIKSKIIASEDGYPIYSEDNEYIGFIEHWVNAASNIYHYYVYYPDRVEYWNNEGGDLQMVESKTNLSGLPIHRHNMSNWNEYWGESFLEDLIPLMDTLEDFLSKMDDSIYTLVLNPVPTENGGRIPDIDDEGGFDANAVGYLMHLEKGAELKFNNANLDSSSIKLYLDTINQHLIQIGCMPSLSMGQSNIANISQEVIEIVYQSADNLAKENSCWILEGINKRFEIITKLLEKYQNLVVGEDDYIDASLNYNKIVNTKDLMDNLKTQRDIGAISLKDVAEISPYTPNVEQTFMRLKEEDEEKQKKMINNPLVNSSNDVNNQNNNDSSKGSQSVDNPIVKDNNMMNNNNNKQ